MAVELHDDCLVIDALVVSDWSRAVFEDMRAGGISAANCTCSIWEGFRGSMANLARWRGYFAEHADLLLKVTRTADIRRAKAEGKVGIILGWQNTAGIEDRLEYLGLFKALGVGVMQLTYNTQNWVGSGCFESRDAGLSDFGREVVAEMNRLGIAIDLSHVGATTSRDAILASRRPVAYTHCCPAGLKAHPRNKSDAELRFIADHGGYVGVTVFPPFLAAGEAATVEDCVQVMEYVIDRVGEERVGIGTDFTQGHGASFFDYLRHDKGHARRVVPAPSKAVVMPRGLGRLGEWGNLTRAMQRRGWREGRIRRVLGENWMTFLAAAWGE